MSALAHDANVLGALALAVSDRTLDAVAEGGELSETAAAALSPCTTSPPGRRWTTRPIVGLTSSGAVRLVSRLQAAGYVEREAGGDARVRHVRSTPRGGPRPGA